MQSMRACRFEAEVRMYGCTHAWCCRLQLRLRTGIFPRHGAKVHMPVAGGIAHTPSVEFTTRSIILLRRIAALSDTNQMDCNETDQNPRIKWVSNYLDESTQFFLRVENHNVEWRPWNVFAGPAHFNSVISWFSWVVLANDRSIFLIFSLHFDAEGTFQRMRRIVKTLITTLKNKRVVYLLDPALEQLAGRHQLPVCRIGNGSEKWQERHAQCPVRVLVLYSRLELPWRAS